MKNVSKIDDICQKWNKPVAEATCNICISQCDLSIADPANVIARKLIVDMEIVNENRIRHDLDPGSNNMDYLKNEIETAFKDRACMIIDSMGLSHMRVPHKKEKA